MIKVREIFFEACCNLGPPESSPPCLSVCLSVCYQSDCRDLLGWGKGIQKEVQEQGVRFKGFEGFGWCSIIKPILHYLHSTSSSSEGQKIDKME